MNVPSPARCRIRFAACSVGLALVASSVAGCSSEKSVVSSKADTTVATEGDTAAAPDLSIPGLSIPDLSIPDLSIPGLSIPEINSSAEALDFVIQQLELAGVAVDRDCIETFLEDADIREQINTSGGQLSPQLLQSFFTCIKP